MTSLTRGPLPARVYWVRRVLVLGTALLLVLGIARVLSGGSDAASAPQQATEVAADPTPTATIPTPTATRTQHQPGKGKTSHAPVLAQPDGPCSDEDIAVEPDVRKPVAGQDVTIVLRLRTISADACTWRVSHDSLTLKITSGKDDIWSSRQCPRAIPKESVVVRQAVTSKIEVIWKEARRSDDGCTRLADWAYPGWYHVTAAALGGEPADLQFQLAAPTGPVITKSPSPSAHGNGNGHGHKPSDKPSGRPVPSGSATTD